MQPQHSWIRELFGGSEPAWLLVADAARADVIENVIGDRHAVDRVHNGGCTSTVEWFHHHFPPDRDLAFFSAGLPLARMSPGFDAREHFAYVQERSDYDVATGGRSAPDELNTVVKAYANNVIADRLADLGYAAPTTPDSGVVRYMDPHRPYPIEGYGLPELSRDGGDAPMVTQELVDDDVISIAEVEAAYEEACQMVVDAALELAFSLDGRVVLTSDHGECLGYCGQWYHGPDHEPHDHLTTVPWVVLQEGGEGS